MLMLQAQLGPSAKQQPLIQGCPPCVRLIDDRSKPAVTSRAVAALLAEPGHYRLSILGEVVLRRVREWRIWHVGRIGKVSSRDEALVGTQDVRRRDRFGTGCRCLGGFVAVLVGAQALAFQGCRRGWLRLGRNASRQVD